MHTKTKISIKFVIIKVICLFFLTHTLTFAQPLSWLQEEMDEKRDILRAFWDERIINYHEKSVTNFKSMLIDLHFPKDPVFEAKINNAFQDAIQQKITFDSFLNSLKNEPLVFFKEMNAVEKLIPEKNYKEIEPDVTQADLIAIQQYIKSKNLSVSLTLGSAKSKLITPTYPENQYQYPFAIHSIGKVFTGTLVLVMIEQGVLTEEALKSPVQLDKTVLKKLPVTVREQLKKVTLHQLMTHRGGLGDYLGKYFKAIESGQIPVIKRAEDFLPFVDAEVFPVGEERYSNVGLLLVGLAIKHAYETKYKHPINYNVLLNNMLIDPIGLTSFSITKPDNAKYNLDDPIAPFLAGSPAGGYWITSEDLATFGQWLFQKAKFDPKFNYLIKKYGQEFYHADTDTIVHGGGIRSSSAFFSVSLKTGAVLVIESNQPPGLADDLKTMIQHHIFATVSTFNGKGKK